MHNYYVTGREHAGVSLFLVGAAHNKIAKFFALGFFRLLPGTLNPISSI